MADDSGYSSKLPSKEEIEEGRKSSLILGLVVGGVVVVVGIIAYLIFGKYLVL